MTAKKDEQLIVDYILYFQNKTGNGNNKKIFKIKRIAMTANQKIMVNKKHQMLGEMTTRKLYPGEHKIEIQINGKKAAEKTFDLVV